MLVHREKITTLFTAQVYFYFRVKPEAITQHMVQLPAELVIFNSSSDTQQPCVGKKIICQFVNVQLQLQGGMGLLKLNRKCFFCCSAFQAQGSGISFLKVTKSLHIGGYINKAVLAQLQQHIASQ